jgi:hypothetical protein
MAACMPRPFPEDNLPVAEQRPVVGTFQASYDTTWEATIEVLGDMAPLEQIEKDNGYISTGWMEGFSDYIFKTYAGTKVPEPIRSRWEINLTSQGSRTEVTVIAQEEVEKDMISANLEFRGSIYEWIPVPSSTSKERQMLEEILAIIETRAGVSDAVDYEY